MAARDEDRRERLRRLQEAFEKRGYILRNPDVLGYAVGTRYRGGERTEEPALIVYVRPGRKRTDPRKLPRHRRIPERIRLQVEGETVWLPVDLVETQPGRPQAPASGSAADRTLSVGPGEGDRTGTVGWIDHTSRASKDVVFCTALHVLLSMTDSRLQGTIRKTYRFQFPDFEHAVSPSVRDGGGATDGAVGWLLHGERSNVLDVGVVQVSDRSWLEGVVRSLGTVGPPRALDPVETHSGSPVQVTLRGRSSGEVTGRVLEYPAHFVFAYEDREVQLLGLIATDIATREGDSGALLLDSERRALGMLVGLGGDRSFFMTLPKVIDAMELAGQGPT